MIFAVKINYLFTLLRGEALREFDKLASHNNGTTNAHLNSIQKGLLGNILLLNAITNQNIAMRCSIRKPCILAFLND